MTKRIDQVRQDILKHLETKPNLPCRVIVGDESQIFDYDPETKHQNLQCRGKCLPRPKKAKQSKSKVKVTLIVFFDIRGVVHCDFLPQDRTINQYVYKGGTVAIYLLNAQVEVIDTLSINLFLAEKKIALLEQPPNQPPNHQTWLHVIFPLPQAHGELSKGTVLMR